jgi:hypothetical protein
MMDEFQFWRDAVAGKPVVINEGAPQSGYYKTRTRKDGPWAPVAIWTVNGKQVCRVGNEQRDPASVWVFCAGHPVSKDAAKHAFETGTWPGDAPEIGHNSGDLSLAEQITEYASMALAWLKKTGIKDKVTADTAANYRAKLNELKKEADNARTTEKAPHMAAAKAVDDKWRVPIAEATAAAEDIRAALTQFMVAEEKRLRAEQDAQRKAEEERIARERAEKMASDPIAAMTDPEPELPMAPEPVKVQAGGQRGRRTGLRTVKKVRITDYQAAAAHFAANEEIKVVLDKLTSRLVLAGANVPFAETYDEKVAA